MIIWFCILGSNKPIGTPKKSGDAPLYFSMNSFLNQVNIKVNQNC
jgi:hypothetical protein